MQICINPKPKSALILASKLEAKTEGVLKQSVVVASFNAYLLPTRSHLSDEFSLDLPRYDEVSQFDFFCLHFFFALSKSIRRAVAGKCIFRLDLFYPNLLI